MIGVCLASQSTKKAHTPLYLLNVSNMCQPCLITRKCFICFMNLPVLCSRDLHVLRAQRIVGVFILITHKLTRSENSITRVRRDPIQDGRLIVKRSTDLHGSCLNLFSQWPPQLTSCQGFVYTVFRFSSQYWRDFRLTWNVSDYGGIQSFVTSSRKVWLPDITLYNKYVLVLFT